MSEQDKKLVEEELRMHMAYDWFLDDNPDVQERVEKGELRGEKGTTRECRRAVTRLAEIGSQNSQKTLSVCSGFGPAAHRRNH